MSEVVVNKTINVSARDAWNKLSSFRGIEEFSPIASSETTGEGVGATRICYMPDGAAIYETLNKVDENNMEFEYEINKGPFPITRYVSTVKVEAIDETKTKITWGCEFDSAPEAEAEMTQVFEGFYTVIIESLEGVLQN
ncbi:MAG: SRPBCC family protein [Flavobacteriaceae bacterium]|nr:SRPBCC family protein [Flavobacteriaceae bacterium]